MLILSFDSRDESDPNSPFPVEFSDDPLTLYHGASSANEALIEQRGLTPGESLFTLEQLLAISSIFHDLNWAGSSLGSLCVLEPYSIGHDFAGSGAKPVYLAESAHRAATYASYDFAGGEIARTVRICMSELWSYAQDPSVRETHTEQLKAELDYCKMVGAPLPVMPKADLARIEERLRQLDPVYKAACRAEELHAHGVVYAIRLSEQVLSRSEIHGSMGIKCFETLPPEMIIGKALVSNQYEHDPFEAGDPLYRPLRHRALHALIAQQAML